MPNRKLRLWESDEIIPSNRERKADKLKRYLRKKQQNTAVWANKYYGIKNGTAKRLETLEKRLTKKHQLEVDKLKARFEKRKKTLNLDKLQLNGKIKRFRIANAKLASKARSFDRMQNFFTTPLQNRQQRLLTTELFIRYMYTLEEMQNTEGFDKYRFFLLLCASQGEYITRQSLENRYGLTLTAKLMKCVTPLINSGMIVKIKKNPIRLALTELGRKELTSIVYTAKNRNMPNYL